MDGPPAVENGDRVVVELEQRGQIQDGGECEPGHQHAFRRCEALRLPDRHAEVVEKHQHHDDDGQLHRQRLLEELVPGGPAKEVSDHGRDAGHGPQAEGHVRHLRAVQLGSRFLGHEPVRRAHEAGEHPDNQQVGVNRLRDVEGQKVDQRIGAEVLRGRQQPEGHLEAVEQQRHDEVGIGDGLSAIAHLGSSYLNVAR